MRPGTKFTTRLLPVCLALLLVACGGSTSSTPTASQKAPASQQVLNNPNGLQFWEITWIADYPDPQDWTTLRTNADSTQ
jgi:hypothetical protein